MEYRSFLLIRFLLSSRYWLDICFNFRFSYNFNNFFYTLNSWFALLSFLNFLFTHCFNFNFFIDPFFRLFFGGLFNLFFNLLLFFNSRNRCFFHFGWMILRTKRTILAQLQLLKLDELNIVMIEHDSARLHRSFLHQANPVQKLRGHDFSTDGADNHTGSAYWVVVPWQEGNITVIEDLFRQNIVDSLVEASGVIEADEARRPSLWVKVYSHRHCKGSAHYQRDLQLNASRTDCRIELVSPIYAIEDKSRLFEEVDNLVPVGQGISMEVFNLRLASIVKLGILIRALYLRLADILMGVEQLSVEIVDIDHIVVHKEQLAHAQSQQIYCHD